MRSPSFIWIIVVLMGLLDLYVFQAVKVISSGASPRTRLIIYTVYWSLSGVAILLLLLMPLINYEKWPRAVRTYLFATILGLLFAKLIAVVFFLLDDMRRAIQWATGKIFFRNTEGEAFSGEGITRSLFLSWLGVGVGLHSLAHWYMDSAINTNTRLGESNCHYNNLPKSFRGLKIVQISDIHSGSFTEQRGCIAWRGNGACPKGGYYTFYRRPGK